MSGQPFPQPPLPHGQPNDGLAPPSSARKLKRKHPGSGGTGGGSMGPNGPHSRQQQQQQQQQRGDRPPGAAGPGPTLGLPMSTGPMGWGSAFEDENTDIVLDEIDRLTPRDLCVTRFRRNHELMELIFDERKIANLQPSDSPYSNLSVSTLRAQAEREEQAMEQMKQAHEDRMRYFKENLSPAFLEKSHREAEEGVDLEESVEPWSRGASKGKVVSKGFGYVRAPTPDFIKAARQGPASKEPETPQPASQADTTMNVDADGTADADADADADGDVDADADADVDVEGEGQDEAATWTPEQRKAKEAEFLQQLHVKHGLESPAAPVPSPPSTSASQGSQQHTQQPAQAAEEPTASQGASAEPASSSAPESAPNDTEMDDVVQGDTGAGIAVTGGDTLSEDPVSSSLEGNQANTSAPDACSTLPPTKSASVTHPLSAEAAAASEEQAPATASEPQAASQPALAPTGATTEGVSGASASEKQGPGSAMKEGAAADSEQTAAEPGAEKADGGVANAPQTTSGAVPSGDSVSEVQAASSATSAEASSGQPTVPGMKAPTPPLTENLADNDAPLDFDAVASSSAEAGADPSKQPTGDVADVPQPETQGSPTVASETQGA